MEQDYVYRFNHDRWEALVKADALFSRPWLGETKESALRRLDPLGLLGDVAGKDVLCLAGGGGQQSVAFALNGAHVSVLDISAGQLERDRQAAHHYGYSVNTIQGDMRDLGVFNFDTFDIVSQPYSLNFVPDCREVFVQVARVLRSGGLYSFWAANPFASGLGTKSWNGTAYEVKSLYQQGQQVQYEDERWVFSSTSSTSRPPGPQEYRQLLSTLVNGLIDQNFNLLHLREEMGHAATDASASGEWVHFTAVLPPWLSFLAQLNPKHRARP
jgi:ubiquinone/menaquinone biosynthesis C-methylase UbiE